MGKDILNRDDNQDSIDSNQEPEKLGTLQPSSRDKEIIQVQQSPAFTINTSGGDFVGRDNQVFQGENNIILGSNNIVNIESIERRVSEQITRLRGRVTRLIPTQKQLFELRKLREPSSVLTGFSKFLSTEVSLENFSFNLIPLASIYFSTETQPQRDHDDSEKSLIYLEKLSEIESRITGRIDQIESPEWKRDLSFLADEINMAISTATQHPIVQITVIPSAYPHHYSEAFASESIFPTRCIRLAPTQTLESENKRVVTSFLIAMGRVFRAALYTGVRGSACWSTSALPTPHYPCPFGTPSALACSAGCFLRCVKHAFVFLLMNSCLMNYQIRLPVLSSFTPASGIDG